MGRLIGPGELQIVVDRLHADGRTVLAPVRRNGVLVVEEVDGLDDLPVGWRDEQSPGRYRLVPSEGPGLFGATAPTPGWKRHLYPERTLLVRARRDDAAGFAVDDDAGGPDAARPRYAFLGVRACDVAAIDRLDRVLLAEHAVDPDYARRRADLMVVAVTCLVPGGTCFCASAGCGPVPGDGTDLRLTELVEHPDGHRFLAEPCTDQGAALVEGLGRPATSADTEMAGALAAEAVGRMGRTLDAAAVVRAGGAMEHPRWDEVATRCLACTNCTMVCPTCFCSTTEDRTDLGGDVLERWRRWDSCFSLDFSWTHGGHVRPSVRARYRQWLLHKLVTWPEQFGTTGCVGCGRCITWCPVGIDLTEEIAAVGAEP